MGEIIDIFFMRIAIISQIFGALWLFMFRVTSKSTVTSRPNLMQMALIHSTILIFMVIIATGRSDYRQLSMRGHAESAVSTLMKSPLQIIFDVRFDRLDLLNGVFAIWIISWFLIFSVVADETVFGWIDDHGTGEN